MTETRSRAWFKPGLWDWGAFALWSLIQFVAVAILGFLLLRGFLH